MPNDQRAKPQNQQQSEQPAQQQPQDQSPEGQTPNEQHQGFWEAPAVNLRKGLSALPEVNRPRKAE